MNYAVVETGGKQYRLTPGKTIMIEKLAGKKTGDAVSFDKVLLLDDGKGVKVGAPYLEGVTVEAVIEGEGKSKKITIIQYKAKTRARRKQGHRQPFMKVQIKK
ncbi:MAG TPA: 50S ribosomal protein L21 [Candidatus Paceibacterota bacterium]